MEDATAANLCGSPSINPCGGMRWTNATPWW